MRNDFDIINIIHEINALKIIIKKHFNPHEILKSSRNIKQLEELDSKLSRADSIEQQERKPDSLTIGTNHPANALRPHSIFKKSSLAQKSEKNFSFSDPPKFANQTSKKIYHTFNSDTSKEVDSSISTHNKIDVSKRLPNEQPVIEEVDYSEMT